MGPGVGPGVDGRKELAIGAIVDAGERRRKTVSVDLDDGEAEPLGPGEQRRQQMRRPSDATV